MEHFQRIVTYDFFGTTRHREIYGSTPAEAEKKARQFADDITSNGLPTGGRRYTVAEVELQPVGYVFASEDFTATPAVTSSPVDKNDFTAIPPADQKNTKAVPLEDVKSKGPRRPEISLAPKPRPFAPGTLLPTSSAAV